MGFSLQNYQWCLDYAAFESYKSKYYKVGLEKVSTFDLIRFRYIERIESELMLSILILGIAQPYVWH